MAYKVRIFTPWTTGNSQEVVVDCKEKALAQVAVWVVQLRTEGYEPGYPNHCGTGRFFISLYRDRTPTWVKITVKKSKDVT